MEQVREANPSLKSFRMRGEAQKERVPPAGTWDDPFFAIGPDEVPVSMGESAVLRFQLSQSIPFPGKLGLRKRIASLRAESAQSDADASERTLKVLAHQTFLRLVFNQNARALNQQIRSLLANELGSAQARYKTGDATHHEWLLSKLELSVLEVERLRLERDHQVLTALFNELRDQPPEALVEIEVPDFSKLLQQADQEMGEAEKQIQEQPELKSAAAVVHSFEAEETLAKLGYAPDFVIQGMGMQSLQGPSMFNWGLMMGLNLPIFFFRKQSNLVSAAQFEKEAALAERRRLENRLRTELREAHQQLKTARDIVRLYMREVVPATEIAAKNARVGYAARRLPLSQFLDVLKTQRTQALELLASRIDVILGSVRVRELLSNPPVIRLAPGRPTLFGSGGMSSGTSGSVSLGGGMSGSTSGPKKSGIDSSQASGMGGM